MKRFLSIFLILATIFLLGCDLPGANRKDFKVDFFYDSHGNPNDFNDLVKSGFIEFKSVNDDWIAWRVEIPGKNAPLVFMKRSEIDEFISAVKFGGHFRLFDNMEEKLLGEVNVRVVTNVFGKDVVVMDLLGFFLKSDLEPNLKFLK